MLHYKIFYITIFYLLLSQACSAMFLGQPTQRCVQGDDRQLGVEPNNIWLARKTRQTANNKPGHAMFSISLGSYCSFLFSKSKPFHVSRRVGLLLLNAALADASGFK